MRGSSAGRRGGFGRCRWRAGPKYARDRRALQHDGPQAPQLTPGSARAPGTTTCAGPRVPPRAEAGRRDGDGPTSRRVWSLPPSRSDRRTSSSAARRRGARRSRHEPTRTWREGWPQIARGHPTTLSLPTKRPPRSALRGGPTHPIHPPTWLRRRAALIALALVRPWQSRLAVPGGVLRLAPCHPLCPGLEARTPAEPRAAVADRLQSTCPLVWHGPCTRVRRLDRRSHEYGTESF